MNIHTYTAALNSGVIITETTTPGTELPWRTLHWSHNPNRVKTNHIELQESERGTLLAADISLELQPFTETMSFAEINPVTITLDIEEATEIMAFYHFKDWWTRPAFIDSFDKVPDETTMIFYRDNAQTSGADLSGASSLSADARLPEGHKLSASYRFLIALPGRVFRAHFEGGSGAADKLNLVLSADAAGYNQLQEVSLLAVEDEDPYRCFEKGMSWAAELYDIPLRDGRSYPTLLEKIGWCSWDAFYKDVNEGGLTAKAEEIRDKKIPFGWMLIDDGWQDYNETDRMTSFGVNLQKFPNGLKGCAEKVEAITGIHEIGVWHAFSGYWNGIDPEGPLAKNHPNWFMESHQGKLLLKPEPEIAKEFFGTWYQLLNSQGIRFVKVDSQSSTRQHYRTNTPIGKTGAALHQGLDWAAETYMNGTLINCMGQALEDVLQRPISGVSRNSDDFFPLEEASFKEHLLENAYNCLYHNHIYYGDWDMFWSTHPCAEKHAILRAISGGPIYVSDRVGETVREVLMPLCYEDGTILRAEQGAVPTVDSLFADPEKRGYLKLQNVCHGVGYLAVYSYKEESLAAELGMQDLSMLQDKAGENMEGRTWAVYNPLTGTGFTAGTDTTWTHLLDREGYTLYQAALIEDGFAVFGRVDKYLSSHVIRRKQRSEEGWVIELQESGPILIYADHLPVCTVDGKQIPVNLGAGEGFYTIDLAVGRAYVTLQLK